MQYQESSVLINIAQNMHFHVQQHFLTNSLKRQHRIEQHIQSCLIKVEDVQSLQSQMQIVLQEVRILLRCYLRNCMRATKANTIYCIVVNMSSGAIQHQLRAQRDGHHVRSDLHKYFVTICDDTQRLSNKKWHNLKSY